MGVHNLVYTVTGTASFSARHATWSAHIPRRGAKSFRSRYTTMFTSTWFPVLRRFFATCPRVPPGSLVDFERGAPKLHRYWQMQFREDRDPGFATLKQEFREALDDAVRDYAAENGNGTFLSGGTDSSTISGLVGKVTGKPARTFSIGFDSEGYDEMHYARLAAQHFGTDQHEYYVTPDDVVDAIPRIAAAYDQPFGNASAIPTYYCARARPRALASQRMLGGDGGDELFGGNSRYAQAASVLASTSASRAIIRRARAGADGAASSGESVAGVAAQGAELHRTGIDADARSVRELQPPRRASDRRTCSLPDS